MKILLAVQDKLFLDDFLEILKRFGLNEIMVLHVVESPHIGFYSDLAEHEKVSAKRKEMIADIVKEIERSVGAVAIKGLVIEGDPKEEIIRMANAMEANLIIMGSHGRGAFGRFFLGSVSLAVHAAAPCSILILRRSRQAEMEKVDGSRAVVASS